MANWRAHFECYFCLWHGPAYKTTLIALKRLHTVYLLTADDADMTINFIVLVYYYYYY